MFYRNFITLLACFWVGWAAKADDNVILPNPTTDAPRTTKSESKDSAKAFQQMDLELTSAFESYLLETQTPEALEQKKNQIVNLLFSDLDLVGPRIARMQSMILDLYNEKKYGPPESNHVQALENTINEKIHKQRWQYLEHDIRDGTLAVLTLSTLAGAPIGQRASLGVRNWLVRRMSRQALPEELFQAIKQPFPPQGAAMPARPPIRVFDWQLAKRTAVKTATLGAFGYVLGQAQTLTAKEVFLEKLLMYSSEIVP